MLFFFFWVSETALCDPLRGPDHLFVQFPIFSNYFCTVLVCFGSIVGELTPFFVLRIVPSFLSDKEWK
jgi:hypothetical protein